MKINKKIPISYSILSIFPIGGLFLSFFSLEKGKMNRIPFFLMSLFYFFIIIKIPPLGDLYRRYLEFSSYSNGITIYSVMLSHTDILFYLNAFFFKKLNISFFWIPALYSLLMTYFYLASFRNISREISGNKKFLDYRLVYLSVFCSLPIFNYALGLRFGLAVIFCIYAITSYFYRSKIRGILFFLLSIMMHFSIIIVLISFLCSLLFSVRKAYIIPLCLIFYLFSKYISLIVPAISFMNIGDHVSNNYINGQWSEVPTNTNTLIAIFLSMGTSIIPLIIYISRKSSNNSFESFINLFIPFCFLFFISFNAFERYLSIACYFINFRYLYMHMSSYSDVMYSKNMKIFNRWYLIFFVIMSMFFMNLYIQRRTLTMGDLWSSFYTSPVFLLNYSSTDFNRYLEEIDDDGFWIKDHQKL